MVAFSPGTTTSPSMIAEPAAMCQASSAILRKRLVQSLPRLVHGLVHEVDLNPIAVEFDLVEPAVTDVAREGRRSRNRGL